MNTHVKTALITGANKGIGFQTAKELVDLPLYFQTPVIT